MMRRLRKWFQAEPTIRQREPIVSQPVTLDSVKPAEPPSEQIAIETKAAQEDLAQALLKLGRRSYDLRMALARSALAHATGGHS